MNRKEKWFRKYSGLKPVTKANIKAVPLKRAPDETVVAAINTLLEKAKRGDVQGFAYCALADRGYLTTDIVGASKTFEMAGALEALKSRLLMEQYGALRLAVKEVVTDGATP